MHLQKMKTAALLLPSLQTRPYVRHFYISVYANMFARVCDIHNDFDGVGSLPLANEKLLKNIHFLSKKDFFFCYVGPSLPLPSHPLWQYVCLLWPYHWNMNFEYGRWPYCWVIWGMKGVCERMDVTLLVGDLNGGTYL